MTTRSSRIGRIAAATVVVVAALAIGFWMGRRPPDIDRGAKDSATQESTGVASPAKAAKAMYWYDPMMPDQHFSKPGKSPFMDMQLVPKYADAEGAAGVSIASGMLQSLGVRTVVAKRGSIGGAIRVPGTVAWDLRQERVVSARVDAVVEQLLVRAPYQSVHQAQPLVRLLAPEWSSAIAEARVLGGAQSDAARSMQSAAHGRLHVLGVPPGASSAGNGTITLTAPVTGIVTEIGVREGQATSAGMVLFRINGTATVWLEAAIPQAALGTIAAGATVEASISSLPGRRFNGRVEALLPQLDAGSRTQQARIVLDNADGVLVPGMFAEISVFPAQGEEQVLVPADAVIGNGLQARVIVQDDGGRFRPVNVTSGRSAGGMTEILSGLAGDERVVASGQFLIDSEASLSGAFDRLGPSETNAMPATTPTTPTESMGGSDMAGMAMPADPDAPTKTPAMSGKKVLYWYDPMKPEHHFDKPGKSPYMDMQLVPKYGDDAPAGDAP